MVRLRRSGESWKEVTIVLQLVVRLEEGGKASKPVSHSKKLWINLKNHPPHKT